MLFAAISVWCLGQVTRNVYECSFVLPIGVMAVLLALAAPHGSALLRRICRWLAIVLAPLMLVNAGLVTAIYGPYLWSASHNGPYLDKQHYSVSVYSYLAAKPDILGAAKLCGLAPEQHANALLLDDVTYFAFMESHLPLHQLGVLPRQFRGSITDPIAYLRNRNSAGAILGCHWLNPEQRTHAKQQGQFCCLAPPGW